MSHTIFQNARQKKKKNTQQHSAIGYSTVCKACSNQNPKIQPALSFSFLILRRVQRLLLHRRESQTSFQCPPRGLYASRITSEGIPEEPPKWYSAYVYAQSNALHSEAPVSLAPRACSTATSVISLRVGFSRTSGCRSRRSSLLEMLQRRALVPHCLSRRVPDSFFPCVFFFRFKNCVYS